MRPNSYRPHILVIPEDDANRQMANGFVQHPDVLDRAIQILPVAGGWTHVVKCFKTDHIAYMRKYRTRLMILLIDFDRKEDRLPQVKTAIPVDLEDRVFVLGAFSEPEDLTKERLGALEEIGKKLANDCREDASGHWDHQLLRHNAAELVRLRQSVRPILFAS